MATLTTCADMPLNGSIGIASWGGTDSALYYTDSSQGIRERTYHNGTWNGGTTSDVIFSGKHTTPLAVMQWFWKMSGTIPMVCLQSSSRILQFCSKKPVFADILYRIVSGCAT